MTKVNFIKFIGKPSCSVPKRRYGILFLLVFIFPVSSGKIVKAQSPVTSEKKFFITGKVTNSEEGKALKEAQIFVQGSSTTAFTDKDGNYRLGPLPSGNYEIAAFYLGKQSRILKVDLKENKILNFEMEINSQTLEAVNVEAEGGTDFGIGRLSGVDGFGIYESKKTELIALEKMTVNKAANKARQIYGKVPGLNIWETDGSGLQLAIGARGLSPSRNSNFNTRQNGYDISADALGYPESYYTPPAEAVERIEIVRGAASLQYGTQFGGMLNFKMKDGPDDDPFEMNLRQSIGSFGFFSSFNSIGGTVGKHSKVKYYGFYQFKRGDGWRENSGFEQHNLFGSISAKLSEKLRLSADYTYMSYVTQQPGGLTDRLFEEDPRKSLRERNWFKVDWNLASLSLDYQLNDFTKLNIRNFALVARRQAVGNLERINVIDFGENRTLIRGQFQNVGSEVRLVHRYKLFGLQSVALGGMRYYQGQTQNSQGEADATSDPNFSFLNPENPENSDFTFPSRNLSFFAENIFRFSERFSITPGMRFEYIGTFSEGYFRQFTKDAAGNVVAEQTVAESLSRRRKFVLLGLGMSFKPTENTEFYANLSQNYRAINFNDLRVVNPNFAVDTNIKDERGYNADFGFRADFENFLITDISAFYLRYQDRIGLLIRADEPPLYLPYRYRTNIADSRTYGLEAFAEINLMHLFQKKSEHKLSIFVNTAFTNARYINSDDTAIDGKEVELVVPFSFKTGLNYGFKGFSTGLQYAYTHRHFTDATNAEFDATAVSGIVPSYNVVDFSASYSFKRYSFEVSCNNLLDTRYFTQRASGYPGPGIIPADGRAFFITLGLEI